MPFVQADVEEQYRKFKELKREDVQALQEWAGGQPELPPIDELQMILFLHSNFYNMDDTKTCITKYYFGKRSYPELFTNRNPLSPELQQSLDVVMTVPMPNVTSKGYIVLFQRLIDFDPSGFDYAAHGKHMDMVITRELRKNGAVPGFVIVANCVGFSWSHLFKFSLSAAKRQNAHMQEAQPIRLQEVHLVNTSPIMSALLSFFRPFTKKEILENTHWYGEGDENLYDYVPRCCLPEEVGGTLGSSMELARAYRKEFEDSADFFLEEERMNVTNLPKLEHAENVGLWKKFWRK